MNNTLTTNTLSTANYLAAADDIISILETMEFSTHIKFENEMLRQSIVQAIRQNIEDVFDDLENTEEDKPVSMEELLNEFRQDLKAENPGLCSPGCCHCHDETPDGLGNMGKNADGRL
jgi:UDP-N-acetylmuramoylalanine-D-glutamate ligase